MSQQRRRNWTQTAAKVIVVLMALDAVLYVAAVRPLTNLVAHEQERFTATRLEWLRHRASLARLSRRDEALPVDQKQVKAFLEEHLPVRHQAYSRTAGLIQQLSQRSNVEITGVKYSREETQKTPLESLGLEASAQGPFSNLLDFAHGLETSSDFIVLRSFQFVPGDQGVLALHLKAYLYMAP